MSNASSLERNNLFSGCGNREQKLFSTYIVVTKTIVCVFGMSRLLQIKNMSSKKQYDKKDYGRDNLIYQIINRMRWTIKVPAV